MSIEPRHIIPPEASVTSRDRESLNGHRGALLWFTGLSGSGKSTITQALDRELTNRGVHSYVLDGDRVRTGLNGDLGFSREDRKENLRRISEVAALFVDAGLIVSTAFISPYRRDRDFARQRVPEGRFIEVFVDTPLEECERRDAKGLYKKARAGEIRNFTGIDDVYDPPLAPEMHIKTMETPPDESVKIIVALLEKRGILS